ncbi:MAG: hypothetical protein ACI9U2_001778 [Bradymonadia bacterium]|jgi:hypothetical protein
MLEAALEGRVPRLVSLKVVDGRDASALADTTPRADLAQLEPEDVMPLKWQRDAGGEPSTAILAAFNELVDVVGSQEDTD